MTRRRSCWRAVKAAPRRIGCYSSICKLCFEPMLRLQSLRQNFIIAQRITIACAVEVDEIAELFKLGVEPLSVSSSMAGNFIWQ